MKGFLDVIEISISIHFCMKNKHLQTYLHTKVKNEIISSIKRNKFYYGFSGSNTVYNEMSFTETKHVICRKTDRMLKYHITIPLIFVTVITVLPFNDFMFF